MEKSPRILILALNVRQLQMQNEVTTCQLPIQRPQQQHPVPNT